MPTMRVSPGVPRLVFEDPGSPLTEGMWSALSSWGNMRSQLAAIEDEKRQRSLEQARLDTARQDRAAAAAQAQANWQAEQDARAAAAAQAQANFATQQAGVADDRALRRQALEAEISAKQAEETRRSLGMIGTGINEAAKRGIDFLEAVGKGGGATSKKKLAKIIAQDAEGNDYIKTVMVDDEGRYYDLVPGNASAATPPPPTAPAPAADTSEGSIWPTVGVGLGATGLGTAAWLGRKPLMQAAQNLLPTASTAAPAAATSPGLWSRVTGLASRAVPWIAGATALKDLNDMRVALHEGDTGTALAQGLQAAGEGVGAVVPAAAIASVPTTIVGESIAGQVGRELEPTATAPADTLRAFATGERTPRPGFWSRKMLQLGTLGDREAIGNVTQANVQEIVNAARRVLDQIGTAPDDRDQALAEIEHAAWTNPQELRAALAVVLRMAQPSASLPPP